MTQPNFRSLRIRHKPDLNKATLVLALTGWMDGGDVSTGTVRRLVGLLDAKPFASIDPEPFYLFNFPGSMELTALFRPHIQIKDGLIAKLDMPRNRFYHHEPANLVLFVGKEPNLRWRTFGDCILELSRRCDIQRIVFVGSFGGTVPHTREPRLHVTCSDPQLLEEMSHYGLKRSGYEGPGSFTSYLMTRAQTAGIQMTSLAVEIPGYLQGRNPMSIEAVTRRLSKILHVPLELQALRAESMEWEEQVSKAIDDDAELAETVRKLEEAYDNALLEEEPEL